MSIPQATDPDEFDLAAVSSGRRLESVAVLSLREALRTYYGTYRTMSHALHMFSGKERDHDTIAFNHPHDYVAAYTHAILHFQHFVELACKEILVDRLGASPSRNKIKEAYNTSFSAALTEIEATPTDPAAAAVARHALGLRKLGRLRNDLIHQGHRVLFYSALDRLVGKDVLPFVADAVALPRYATLSGFWRHPPLHCGIDPLAELVRHFGSEVYDVRKTAYLKELGRAAYESPLYPGPFAKYFNDRLAARSRAQARHSLDNEGNVREVRACPVCGVESLLVLEERDHEGNDDGESVRAWWYTWEVECVCCSFEIENNLGNASDHGLSLEDYWEAGDL